MRYPLKEKKAQVPQILLLMGIVFIMTATVVVCGLILSQFFSAMNESGVIDKPEESSAITAAQEGFLMWNYAIVLGTVIFIGVMVFTSFLIPSHPMFIVFNLIGIFLLVFAGMMFSNIYGQMVAGEDTTLSASADDFNMLNFLMSNLPYIGAVIVFIVSVVMFTRGYGGGGY